MRSPIPGQWGKRMFENPQFSINFSSTVHLRGPLTLTRLENAFTRLGKRYPILVTRIATDDDINFYLTDENTLPVPIRVVKREDADTWVQEVKRDLPTVFNFKTGPLYRCVWVQGDDDTSDLVLTSEHMTTDGRSAIYALRDLLALLADPTLALPPSLPIRLTELVSPEVIQKVNALADSIPPNAPPPQPWRPNISSDPQQILPFSLTKTETATLREQCRAQGVTIQSALCAAFLTSFAERHPDSPMRRVEVPVDLRPYLAQPMPNLHGNYLGLAIFAVDSQAGPSLWDVARHAQSTMRELLGPDLFLRPPAVYQFIQRPIAGSGFSRDYDISISNLGQLDIPAICGDLQVESVHAPIFNVNTVNHHVLGVSTCSGKLCATYISCDVNTPILANHGWELLKQMIYNPA